MEVLIIDSRAPLVDTLSLSLARSSDQDLAGGEHKGALFRAERERESCVFTTLLFFRGWMEKAGNTLRRRLIRARESGSFSDLSTALYARL